MEVTVTRCDNGYMLHVEDTGYQYECVVPSMSDVADRVAYAKEYGTDNLDVFNDNVLVNTDTVIMHRVYA